MASWAVSTPRVSVIIPTYHRSDLVEHAIRSVLAQTFGDAEHHLERFASTDTPSRA